MIPHDDRGLLLGDGLFETLLALDGRLVWAEAHLDRLARGCAALGLPAPDRAAAMAAMDAALEGAGLTTGRAAVRLTLTAGSGGRGLDRPAAPEPRLFASAAPASAAAAPARVIWSGVRRNEGSPASRLKTLSYLDSVLARAEATAAGADEALLLNGRGEAACAAAANLFWIREGRLFTPALDCGVLDGVTRDVVMAAARSAKVETVEVRAGPDDVVRADGAFLTNSLIGVRPISHLEGRAMPGSPLTLQLARAVERATA
jgi:branched-chain amino acid aminotransferase/4-amino-4-deoxychorismate lyase